MTSAFIDPLHFHHITGCNGFEFIAISNIKCADNAIILPNGAILVPWFYSDISKMDGKSIKDSLVHEDFENDGKWRIYL